MTGALVVLGVLGTLILVMLGLIFGQLVVATQAIKNVDLRVQLVAGRIAVATQMNVQGLTAIRDAVLLERDGKATKH